MADSPGRQPGEHILPQIQPRRGDGNRTPTADEQDHEHVHIADRTQPRSGYGKQPRASERGNASSRQFSPGEATAIKHQPPMNRTMSTFTSLTYHIVFGTKYRRLHITRNVQNDLYSYIGGIVRDERGHLLEIGGVEDHVHILADLSPAVAVSVMLRQIKAGSSKWLNERDDVNGRFEWQTGYGAFTVSQSQVPVVRRYIQGQEEHHRTRSFKEEYIEFLKRHGINFEERYLFDDEHHG